MKRSFVILTSIALLCCWAGAALAANTTVTSGSALKSVLEDSTRADGDVITITNGVNPSLASVGYINVTKKITLQGQAGTTSIASQVTDAVGLLNTNMLKDNWPSLLDSHQSFFSNIVNKLSAALPTTSLLGSSRADGIYFANTSKLINLTITGFDVNSTTGATYRPHITNSPVASNVDGRGFDTFQNVAVVGNEITHNNIFDGGILGDRSNNYNTYDVYAAKTVVGLLSQNNRVTSVSQRAIGGALGSWANYDLIDSSIFINNYIQGDSVASGSVMAPNYINILKNSLFYGNESYSTASTARGPIYMYKTDWANDPVYAIELVQNTYFINNYAHGNSAMGGAISVRGTDGLGTLKSSVFAYNVATGTSGAASGGAIDAGFNPTDSSDGSGGGGINLLDGSVFYANKAISTGSSASHNAYGGAIALGGRENKHSVKGQANFDGFTIKDSLFIGNETSSLNGRASGGALYVGTNMAGTSTTGYQTINFITSDGGLTEFSGNLANGVSNGIGVGSGNTTVSSFNVRLNVNPGNDGVVLFADPVTVLMNNGKAFELNRTGGKGEFRWGGQNVFDAAGGAILNLGKGTTVLLPSFNLTRTSTNDLKIVLGAEGKIVLDLPGRNPSQPYFSNPSSIVNSGGQISVSNSNIGDFSEDFVFATGTSLPSASAFTVSPVMEGTGVPGVTTSVSMISDSGQLIVRAIRTGTAAAFTLAGVNSLLSMEAVTTIFNAQTTADRQATYQALTHNLASFTGESLAGPATALLDASAVVIGEMKDNFSKSLGRQAPSSGESPKTNRVWGGLLYRKIDQDSSEGFHGYDSATFGGVIGFSAPLTDNLALGAYVSVGKNSTDYNNIASELDGDYLQFGLVSSIRPTTQLNLTADLSYSTFDIQSLRRLPAFGTASAQYDAKVASVGLEGSYDIAISERTTLSPFLELRYQHLTQDRIVEDGGGIFAMSLDKLSHDDFYSNLGAKIELDLNLSSAVVLTPKASLAWRHRYGNERLSASGRYLSNPGAVPIQALLPDRDQAEVGVGLEVQPGGPDGLVGLDLSYKLAFGKSSQEHNASLTLDFRW
ncbi:MAG: autotransporter outer membrane beta-barrel domain-containing protein [Deltaproteobacteria bacterium]|jgi:hypothetical protein|nr:autotransporter outer membrane beta-barrel domain-containing protein [Deltaproteobacteria bacterium]